MLGGTTAAATTGATTATTTGATAATGVAFTGTTDVVVVVATGGAMSVVALFVWRAGATTTLRATTEPDREVEA